jgi:methionyl-tRNA formyltransferase
MREESINLLRVGMLLGGKPGVAILRELVDMFDIAFVMTDQGSPEVVNLAKQMGLSLFIGNPRDGYAMRFLVELNRKRADILVSANYRFLIGKDLIDYPRLLAINIHGSLLPKYRGRAPLIWAILNGEKESGITIHCIDKGCDTGAILHQERIMIPPDVTGGEMVTIFSGMYPRLIRKVLMQISTKSYTLRSQNEQVATYYGRRRPEDGLICWEWYRDRICNWVRALAPPYPGAFTFSDGNKVMINAVCLSDQGFSDSAPNGIVLAIKQGRPVVKTPNGALMITDFCTDSQLKIYTGDIFNGNTGY